MSKFLWEVPSPDKPVKIDVRGYDLIRDPLLNKGSAFPEDERLAFGLDGLLPTRVNTMDEQAARFEADNCARRSSGLPPVRIDRRLLGAMQHGLPGCAGVAVGLDRLLMLRLGQEVRYLRRNLGGLQRMQLQYAKAPAAPEGLGQGAAATAWQTPPGSRFATTLL